MNMKKGILAAFAVLFLFGFLCTLTKAQKEKKKEIVVGVARNPMIRNTSYQGKGAADWRELFEITADEVKRIYGITLTLKIFPAPKFLFNAFQNKSVDLANLDLDLYLYAKNNGIPLRPFIAGKGSKDCIYVRKDSGIKSLKQLKGKSFANSYNRFLSKKDALPFKENYIWWIEIRKMLLKQGINASFKEFFKEFAILPTQWESVAYSVLLKRFDAFISSPGAQQALIDYDAGFSELIPIACIDTTGQAPTVYREDLDPWIVKTVKNILLHPPFDKLSKEVKKRFKSQIENYRPPIFVDEKDYAIYFQWLKEAEQKGWLKEFDEIMKNTPKPGTKKKDIGGLDVLKTTK